MKTPAQNDLIMKTGTNRRMLIRLLEGILLASITMTADAEDSFQHNALLNPTRGQLMAEARGRVMIYDGLDNEVVEQALDRQFGRIGHMMFIRIRHGNPDGEVSVEDDDC